MSDLIAITYKDDSSAYAALDELTRLQKEHVITLEDAADTAKEAVGEAGDALNEGAEDAKDATTEAVDAAKDALKKD